MDVLTFAERAQGRLGLPELGLASAHMILGGILWDRARGLKPSSTSTSAMRSLKLYEARPQSDKAAGNFAASLFKQAELRLDRRKDLERGAKLHLACVGDPRRLLKNPRPKPQTDGGGDRGNRGPLLTGSRESWTCSPTTPKGSASETRRRAGHTQKLREG